MKNIIFFSFIFLIFCEKKISNGDNYSRFYTNYPSKSEIDNLPNSLFYYSSIGIDTFSRSTVEEIERPLINEMPLQVGQSTLKYFQPRSAIDVITSIANKFDIIIINEAHDSNWNSAFVYKLIESLKPLGYDNYFAEAYNSNITKNYKGKISEAGFYLSNPLKASITKQCIESEMNIFGYEANIKSKNRELEQAENISDKLDSLNYQKSIVHCGYGHAANSPGMMASYLKKLNNELSFLIVDQTSFEKNRTQFENDLINVCDSVKIPSILVNRHHKKLQTFVYPHLEKAYDLQVIIPNNSDYYSYIWQDPIEYSISNPDEFNSFGNYLVYHSDHNSKINFDVPVRIISYDKRKLPFILPDSTSNWICLYEENPKTISEVEIEIAYP